MAKAWPEAAEAFSKAVDLHVKLGSTYDAANAAQEAANCFKNVRRRGGGRGMMRVWIDESMDGWMRGWINGWVEACISITH